MALGNFNTHPISGGGYVHHASSPKVSAALLGGSSGSGSPGSSGSSGMSSGWLNALTELRDYNNAFNVNQVEQLNAFNAAEAQKNRDFQERMARHSYQYAVEDLKAAGLNPVLAALNGGSATPSGSSASGSKATADDTLSSGLIFLMGAMISSNSAMAIAQMNIENQRWMMQNNPNSPYNVVNSILGALGVGNSSAKGLQKDNPINSLIGYTSNNAKKWYGNGLNGYLKAFKSYRK